MALPHAQPGEVTSVAPLGAAIAASKTTTLIKTDAIEVIRLVLPAGKEIATHRVPGELTVQCLEGRIEFTVGDSFHEMSAGQLIALPGGAPHALRAIEDASVLVTIQLAHKQ